MKDISRVIVSRLPHSIFHMIFNNAGVDETGKSGAERKRKFEESKLTALPNDL